MLDLKQYFKPTATIKELRANQILGLDQLSILLERGEKKIDVEAPPGSGKTLFADVIMNYAISLGKTVLVASPLNMQVNQYQSSGFDELITLKGRKHYPCSAGGENAEKSFCKKEQCPDQSPRKNCKLKLRSNCSNCLCNDCLYKKKFKEFINSKKANTNFQLFSAGISNDPDMIIIDESGEISKKVRDLNSFVIPILLKNPKFPDVLKELDSYRQDLVLELEVLKNSTSMAFRDRIEEVETLISKITFLEIDYDKYREPWCISEKQISKKTKFEPIRVNRFLDKLFRDRTVILMSATPPNFPGFKKVIMDSIFPVETRQWYYLNQFGSMVSRDRKETVKKMAPWLSQLKGKTVIHARSYDTGKLIHDELLLLGIRPLLQTNNGSGYTRYDIVEAFLKSTNKDQIAILTNQILGLDLWQPEILNNIHFMPWVNNSEPLAKAMNSLIGKSWQDQHMANDIVQANARIFRNGFPGLYEGKPVMKRSFIPDSSFGWWYAKNKEKFPKNFIESQAKIQ